MAKTTVARLHPPTSTAQVKATVEKAVDHLYVVLMVMRDAVEHAHGLDRSFLHLETLTLVLDGEERTLRDELAPDLAAVLSSLGRRR